MLLNLDNRYVSLRDLVGDRAKTPEPVIANFWATWCAPCRKELPHLLETTAGYGDKVRVLLIAENKMSEREQVAAFAREQGLATKVLLDPYQKTAEKYGAQVRSPSIDTLGNSSPRSTRATTPACSKRRCRKQ